MNRGKIGFILITVILFAYPVIVQAGSPDVLQSNVSALQRLCDLLLGPFDTRRSSTPVGREDVKPFIDATSSLNHYSTGSGLVQEGGWVRGIALFDANNDNLTDIYITHDNNPTFISDIQLSDLRLGNALLINIGNDQNGLPRFIDVSERSGVQELGRKSHGVAIADYDNDGRLDMYITNGVEGLITEDPQRMPPRFERSYGAYNEGEGRNTLLHNDGNEILILENGDSVLVPIFSDQTEFANVGDGRESYSAVWSDIDRDGFVDLFVANFIDLDFWGVRYPGLPADFVLGERNTLYHNNGDGTFTDITESAGVGGTPREQSRVVGNPNRKAVEQLEDGSGREVDPKGVPSHHAFFFDYDGDGFPDLFTANDYNVAEVYFNNGDLTFTDITDETGLKAQGAWMEIGLWDYNNDNNMDLYLTNLGAGAFARAVYSEEGELIYTRYNAIFRNDGIELKEINGREIPIPKYTYASNDVEVNWSESLPPYGLTLSPICHRSLTDAKGFEFGEFGWGAVFPDIDNDGDQDIYWTGGLKRGNPTAQELSLESPGRLLRNDGNGRFVDISVESQVLNLVGVNYRTMERIDLRFSEIGGGLAMGDLNNDGYPDLIVSNDADYTPFAHDEEALLSGEIVRVPTHLFINPGGDNNWIKVKLEGVQSNRAGIGSEVKVFLDNGEFLRRFVLSGDVTGGQNPFEIIFGLEKSEVDRIEVRWPSGVVDIIDNPGINFMIKIVEGSS